MSILIKGVNMPEGKDALLSVNIYPDGKVCLQFDLECKPIGEAIEVPPHGRLIDAQGFSRAMYHEAFETDSDLQRWDSGCWIRYKMFENHLNDAPTVIEAEE